MKSFIFSILLTFFLSIGAIAHDGEEIMAIDRAFNQMAQDKGIVTAFDHYLAQDVVKLDGGRHPIIGHAAVIASIQPPVGATLVWEPRDGRIAASKDLAFTWGTYVYSVDTPEGRKDHHGKYFTIWAKEDGKWRAIADGGNPSPGP